MRRVVHGLLAAALLAAPCARAEQCDTSAEQDVFDLAALKSSLMVLTTGCPGKDSDYNAFVNKYKPELGANEVAFSAFFKHQYGRSAQREQDAYVTNLANAQSQEGIHQGSDFCPHTSELFNEVMALRDGKDLMEFAAGKSLIPPQLGSCARPVPASARTRVASSRAAKKH